MNSIELVLGLVTGASLALGTFSTIKVFSLHRLHKKVIDALVELVTNQELSGAKVEHLYHVMLAMNRMTLANPETLKKAITERKKNYDFAKEIFGEDQKVN
jgi:hypothetical protein